MTTAHDAARIFHDWASLEGLMPDGPAAAITSTPDEFALVQPVSDRGKQILRSKLVEAIAFADEPKEIVVFTKRAAPASKRMLADLPTKIDDISIKYRQGTPAIIGGDLNVPFGGPAYVVRSVAGKSIYTCGSSISVGNFRDAGTIGCLVRDAAGQMYGLSNNHVSGACNFAGVGLPIVAPGIFDVIPNGLSPFTLGFHSRALTMVVGSADNVTPSDNHDAAIFRIEDEALISSFQGSYYDSPALVGDFVPGMQVEKVGRTTGHSLGSVMGQVYGAHAVQYNAPLYSFSGPVSFDPVFAIVGTGDIFSDNGDSGSLITSIGADGQRIAVGIVVGGRADSSAPGGKTTIALPIRPILQGLGVTLVSGHNL
jgi:hypothetical protein